MTNDPKAKTQSQRLDFMFSGMYRKAAKEFRDSNYKLAVRCYEVIRENPLYNRHPITNDDGLYVLGDIQAFADPIGYCYEKLGEKQKAKESAIKQSKILTSNSYHNHYVAGILLEKYNLYKESLDHFMNALEQNTKGCIRNPYIADEAFGKIVNLEALLIKETTKNDKQ